MVSGLQLPRYGAGSYYGFLITARCDLAHVRTDTVNLLPIVPLTEWLKFDACIVILLARLLALEGELTELAEGLSPALPSMIGGDWKVGYELFVRPESSFDISVKSKFSSRAEEHESLRDVLMISSESPKRIASALSSCESFRRLVERERSKRVLALLENKILDAHFLPVVQPSEQLNSGNGYVVLFRQVLSLPGRLLEVLRDGAAGVEDIPDSLRQQAESNLTFPSGVVANVASPHVEHILQRFANVFGRVGVADCSKRYKDWLVKTTSGATIQ